MSAKVSVIIPTWDRPKIIMRSLHSALMQTYQNLEILVVGDGCSLRVQEEYKKVCAVFNDNRIQFYNLDEHVRHDRNAAGLEPRNFGLEKATGNFIAPLDDDDCWFPTHVERCVNIFNEKPEIGLIYGQYVSAGVNPEKTSKIAGRGLDNGFQHSTICHSTVVYRAHYKDVPYEVSSKGASDRWLWTTLYKKGVELYYDPFVHAIRYSNGGQHGYEERYGHKQEKVGSDGLAEP